MTFGGSYLTKRILYVTIYKVKRVLQYGVGHGSEADERRLNKAPNE